MFKFMYVLIMLPFFLFADQIISREGDIVTVVASGEYIMGDSDSRKESRTMALTQAKVNASEVAGTYIESNFESITQQTNGEVVSKVTKQELRSFSAAILQNEITHESFELLANQVSVYKVSIKAKIDLATLRERVKQIGEDKARKDTLVELEKNNKKLLSLIAVLNEQLKTLEASKQINPTELQVLRNQRENIVNQIVKNEQSAVEIIDGNRIVNDYDRSQRIAKEIVDNLITTTMNNINNFYKIKFDEVKILGEEGNDYNVEISGWLLFGTDEFTTFLRNALPEWNYDGYGKIVFEPKNKTIYSFMKKELDDREYLNTFIIAIEDQNLKVNEMSFMSSCRDEKKCEFQIFENSFIGDFNFKTKISKKVFNRNFRLSGILKNQYTTQPTRINMLTSSQLEMDVFVKELNKIVKLAFTYPRNALRLKEQGDVEIQFDLSNQSDRKYKIKKSSGSDILDSYSLKLVEQCVEELSPILKHMDTTQITIPLSYTLTN